MRRLAIRFFFWALLALSACNLGATLWLWQRNPAVRVLAERSAVEFRAAVDRETARVATPDRVAARLGALIAERPRNWLAIDAVSGIARERALALPPELIAARDAARAADNSSWAETRACLACALDASSCPLSATLICQAPMVVTPLGDVAGLLSEAWHAAWDEPVDRVNLTLSIAGLGGTLLAVPSEGSGALLGIGANAARLAHRMHLLTRPMGETILRAARDGVDWAGLRALPLRRMLTEGPDLAAFRRLLRPRAFAPVVSVVEDLGRIEDAVGPVAALHMVRYIDDADDARRLAGASEALGPKVVGRLELFGKSRLLSLTTRLSRYAIGVVGSIFGLIASFGALLTHALHHLLLRRLHRAARAERRGRRIAAGPAGR